MKSSLFIIALITLNIGWYVTMANSSPSACDAVKEKAWKAKQVLRERQRAVEDIQSETRLAYSQLVECRPGAIFSAGRAHRCALAQSNVPLQVQVQLKERNRLHEALSDYQEKIEWVAEECSSDEPMVDQKELLVRISSLEDEIKTLMRLIEQLNAE